MTFARHLRGVSLSPCESRGLDSVLHAIDHPRHPDFSLFTIKRSTVDERSFTLGVLRVSGRIANLTPVPYSRSSFAKGTAPRSSTAPTMDLFFGVPLVRRRRLRRGPAALIWRPSPPRRSHRPRCPPRAVLRAPGTAAAGAQLAMASPGCSACSGLWRCSTRCLATPAASCAGLRASAPGAAAAVARRRSGGRAPSRCPCRCGAVT